jgi:peptide/nickel transport system permease protein
VYRLVEVRELAGEARVTFTVAPGETSESASPLGDTATPATIAKLRSQLGLDKPLLVRYGTYFWGLLQGDMGRSIREMSPVSHLIGIAWPR